MSGHSDFSVKFWGVRGSIACCAPNVTRYGGNTSSLEIRCGGRRLLFDAGSGIRYLGNEMVREEPGSYDIFLTHSHYDHICGLPFFTPLFVPGFHFRIWAGHLLPDFTVHHVLREMMMSPLFPVPLEIFGARIEFMDFAAGDTIDLGDGICLRTTPLNHPDGATGYRVDFDGRSICYLTDTEHVPGQPDRNILRLIEGADIVIYDSMYDEEEYKCRRGWGHSTWEEGARLCDLAGVKTFVAFHHDPDHDDDHMDRVARALKARRPGSVVAREGMVLEP